MDTRLSSEQQALVDVARRLTERLGPDGVVSLDDDDRVARLDQATTEAGWRRLRDDDGDGRPLASGVEAGIVASALGQALGDTALFGPLLAADLLRRVGIDAPGAFTVALVPELSSLAVADAGRLPPAVAVDALGATSALALLPDDGGFALAAVPIAGTERSFDLTRWVSSIPAGTELEEIAGSRTLTGDDILEVEAFALSLASADLVGIMRGALELTVDYAKSRQQFETPIGAFQAVQHLLAEAKTLLEGSISVSQHASWAVDALGAVKAREAAAVAKTYCARAAIEVCEVAVQVHGGYGNTWECMAHVYLRRALLSVSLFGDDGAQLAFLAARRMGV